MTLTELAHKLRRHVETAAESLDDADALDAKELYPVWAEGIDYKAGKRIRYNSVLYRVLQDHTSQASWTPDAAPSLFARVLIPDPEVIPEWVQPDSTNPYMRGDKVTHNGKTWESDIDNNVWEPVAPGTEALWHEVTD